MRVTKFRDGCSEADRVMQNGSERKNACDGQKINFTMRLSTAGIEFAGYGKVRESA